jgi:3-hydroxyisobutyrate dehydrogenase-like beta-hydroxyacid dehydrogenase
VLDRPDETWFAVGLMHKDIRLALATAKELGIAVPSAEAADSALRSAEDLGYEHSDIAALYRTLAQLSPAVGR